MKRCPQCNRVETDDALAFCRADGTALVSDSGTITGDAGTVKFGSGTLSEIETSILPHRTDAGISRGTRRTSGAPVSGPTGKLAKSRQQRKVLIAIAVLVVVLLAGAGLIYGLRLFLFATRSAVAHFQNMKITRVTNEGNVDSVTISSDGKYIAYSLEENGKRSLWTKHLGTGSRVQIAPPVESLAMTASAFSPDGGYVYYTRVDEQNPRGALYQVPVLGGTSKKILTSVSQPVSISPNGKQIAFGRYHLTATEDELLVANADGTNERLLLTVKEPDYLTGASTAWSPDGKMLALGYGSESRDSNLTHGTYDMTISVVSVDKPELKPVTSRGWAYIGNVVWFSDGSGLAFIARETRIGALQIWQTFYPSGELRRITNDLNSYDFYSLTLTADSTALVAVQSDPISQIWIAPEGDGAQARVVTRRKNVQEGRYGLGWTPDGRLVYDSSVNSNASIWIANADGSNSMPLTDGPAEDFAPEVSRDGRYIIFGSTRKGFQIWRVDIDGSNPKQLTESTGTPTFSITPDGNSVVYNPYLGGILKVSIDGGTPTTLVAKGSLVYPQVSPDGRALVYINTLSGVSNLWRQPLDGSPAKQITNFKSDLIYNFAYSRDGHTMAFARGSHTRDAVLISEVK